MKSLSARAEVSPWGQTEVQLSGQTEADGLKSLMVRFRTQPPEHIGGLKLVQMRDSLNRIARTPDGKERAYDGPLGDMVILDFEGGASVTVHPCYMELKVLFYIAVYNLPESIPDVETVHYFQHDLLKRMGEDLQEFCTT